MIKYAWYFLKLNLASQYFWVFTGEGFNLSINTSLQRVRHYIPTQHSINLTTGFNVS